ncbi:type II/IV secretion system protein, partial [Candidatus Gottesmanbacteria bacterium]|nr:type II/IV secretion system protein [Candidatus Gottesmanbacteria bacterium]
MPSAQSILDVLIANRSINPLDASALKSTSLSTGEKIEDLLLKKRIVDPLTIQKAKAQVLGVSFIQLSVRGISPDILNNIPEPVARKYSVFPFDLDRKENILSVAMADPLDLNIIEFLEKKSGKKIQPFLADKDEIARTVDEQYSRNLATEVTQVLKETGEGEVKTVLAGKIGEIIKEAPIAKIVSTILEYAVKSRASDVHIEPQETITRVRYRIDGILHERLALPKSVNEAVVSRIKILSGMKIDERRLPQDGRFNFKIGLEEVDLRVSSLPTVHGEKIVMRLLKKTGGIPTLSDLGLRGLALKNLESAIAKPHGIILITGPTGSGKTTTLYSVLAKLNTTRVNIVTLEDPVEYELSGINQVQINPLAGLTFASGLRSFLRQDPNIILVGEIRDNETTNLAIQAALTGHLVFSTLHTNDAPTAIPRLLDLGAEPFLVASVLNVLVGQRIVRKICASCKEFYLPPAEMIDSFRQILGSLYPKGTREIKFYRGKGCAECNNSGYLGRIGIFEVLPISDKVAKMVLEHQSAAQLAQQAILEGMVTMKQDGYLKVIEGITTIEEVLRVA